MVIELVKGGSLVKLPDAAIEIFNVFYESIDNPSFTPAGSNTANSLYS